MTWQDHCYPFKMYVLLLYAALRNHEWLGCLLLSANSTKKVNGIPNKDKVRYDQWWTAYLDALKNLLLSELQGERCHPPMLVMDWTIPFAPHPLKLSFSGTCWVLCQCRSPLSRKPAIALPASLLRAKVILVLGWIFLEELSRGWNARRKSITTVGRADSGLKVDSLNYISWRTCWSAEVETNNLW